MILKMTFSSNSEYNISNKIKIMMNRGDNFKMLKKEEVHNSTVKINRMVEGIKDIAEDPGTTIRTTNNIIMIIRLREVAVEVVKNIITMEEAMVVVVDILIIMEAVVVVPVVEVEEGGKEVEKNLKVREKEKELVVVEGLIRHLSNNSFSMWLKKNNNRNMSNNNKKKILIMTVIKKILNFLHSLKNNKI